MCNAPHHALCGGEPQLVNLKTMDRRRLVAGLSCGAIVPLVASCATNPVTGRQQFIGLAPSEQQMAQMALSAWNETKSAEKVSTDPAANARLQRVGQKIASVSGLPNQQWEFVVFDKNELNAFVLPGGKVGFYKGLMDLAKTDDQLAVVLGHEVGHVQGRHSAERFSQQTAGQLGMALGGAAIASSASNSNDPNAQRNAQLAMAALGLGVQVGILLPYSRFQEAEADKIGVDNMHKAGYDVTQAVTFWQLMAQNAKRSGPTFLSTHPGPEQRIEALRAYINERGYAQI